MTGRPSRKVFYFGGQPLPSGASASLPAFQPSGLQVPVEAAQLLLLVPVPVSLPRLPGSLGRARSGREVGSRLCWAAHSGPVASGQGPDILLEGRRSLEAPCRDRQRPSPVPGQKGLLAGWAPEGRPSPSPEAASAGQEGPPGEAYKGSSREKPPPSLCPAPIKTHNHFRTSLCAPVGVETL